MEIRSDQDFAVLERSGWADPEIAQNYAIAKHGDPSVQLPPGPVWCDT